MALFKIEFTNMLTEVTSTATIEVDEWIREGDYYSSLWSIAASRALDYVKAQGEDYSLDSIKMIFN